MWLLTPVADRGGFEHVAEVIDLEREGMIHAWVVAIAFVVVADGLARMREENGMAVAVPRL